VFIFTVAGSGGYPPVEKIGVAEDISRGPLTLPDPDFR